MKASTKNPIIAPILKRLIVLVLLEGDFVYARLVVVSRTTSKQAIINPSQIKNTRTKVRTVPNKLPLKKPKSKTDNSLAKRDLLCVRRSPCFVNLRFDALKRVVLETVQELYLNKTVRTPCFVLVWVGNNRDVGTNLRFVRE